MHYHVEVCKPSSQQAPAPLLLYHSQLTITDVTLINTVEE